MVYELSQTQRLQYGKIFKQNSNSNNLWQLFAFQLLTVTSLGTFLYPSELPARQGWKNYLSYLLFPLICVTMILTAICLSSIVHPKAGHDYIAVPLFVILSENGYSKLIAASACLLLIVCSTSFLELFPELYKIFVKLATSDWKIFLKQISYENSDSGNPVLAVFIAGMMKMRLVRGPLWMWRWGRRKICWRTRICSELIN